MRRMAWILAGLAGAYPFAAAHDASASGFMVRENSAESVATVFGGAASRAEDLSTVFNNPAGMSMLRGSQIEIGSAVVIPDMHFQGDATVFGTSIPADNSRNVGQVAAIPHFYGVTDLGERWKAGIAVTVPFGNTVDYSEDWSGRYVNIKTAALSADINPNISYRVTDHFTLAAGISLQYLKLDLSSSIPQFLIFGPGTPDGSYLLRVDDWSVGYNFGMLAEPWEGGRIGLTYRSEVDHSMTGHLNFSPATDPALGLTSAPAKADITLPASITGSVTQKFTPDFSLSVDVQYTLWDVFKQVAVQSPPNPDFVFEEQYRNSWMVSLGGVYNLNNGWILRGGVGYDQSPVVDAFRDTGVPDKDRIMVGVGFGYQFTPSSSLDFGYSHYFATGNATMNTSVNAIDPITGAVVLNGEYDNSLNFLALTYRHAF